jgi:dihydrofolate reductase
MSKTTVDITMSLDGFVAAPGDDVMRLHDWLYGLSSFHERHGREGGTPSRDAEVLEEAFDGVGAMVIGKRMFDLALDAWGAEPPFRVPVLVVTHEVREPLVRGATTFTFVNDGVQDAVAQARAAAGDRDVSVGGGANVIQQGLAAGVIDELQVHVVPVLLGDGIRLFDHLGPDPIELEPARVIDSPAVTHLRYRVVR